MVTDETQIKAARDYSLQPVTEQIIGAAFEVHNVLGNGFLEKVYQRAMLVELQLRRVKVEPEPSIKVRFKGVIVGAGIKLGYLVNFGREHVEYKRMVF